LNVSFIIDCSKAAESTKLKKLRRRVDVESKLQSFVVSAKAGDQLGNSEVKFVVATREFSVNISYAKTRSLLRLSSMCFGDSA
jgi:hypothetical protein